MIGQVYGRLKVIAELPSVKQSRMWECLCECGRAISVSTRALNSDQTAHCGCSPRLRSAEQRFWEKVCVTWPTGCWVWTGAKSPGGYGVFRNERGTNSVAHRFSYTTMIGAVPDGLDLDHLCRNRACVNPAHLEPVTRAENLRRGVRPPRRTAPKPECKFGHTFVEGSFSWYGPDKLWRRCLLCRRKGGR